MVYFKIFKVSDDFRQISLKFPYLGELFFFYHVLYNFMTMTKNYFEPFSRKFWLEKCFPQSRSESEWSVVGLTMFASLLSNVHLSMIFQAGCTHLDLRQLKLASPPCLMAIKLLRVYL